MKFRIKKITERNGDVYYVPQVKKLFFWFSINDDNTLNIFDVCSTEREYALDDIQTYFLYKQKKTPVVEYEYLGDIEETYKDKFE